MSRHPMARPFIMALGLVVLAVGCKDDTTAVRTPGTLVVKLTTPNSGQDGAAVVILSGPEAPVAVRAGTGLDLWGGPVQTAQSTIALTGVLSTGAILTIDVAAIELAGQYRATLREVANGNATVALRDLTGYSLAVVR